MGRTSWGTTNLGISSKLYNSCYRSRSGTANCNLSMSNYIRKSVTPQLYDGNTGTTNSSISTYVYNQGFVYGIKLRNDSPARGTASIRASLTTVASTSSNSGEIGGTINFISNDYSFINIRFTASSGNQFDGWRTGNNSGGGTLITTSTSYNAYYTNTYIINYSTWYANTSASAPPRNSTVLGYWGPSAAGACFSYDNQTVYYSNSAPSALSSPALFRFSTGTTKSPSGYYSTGSIYRLWNSGGYFSGTINYCFF